MTDQPQSKKLSGQVQAAIVAGIFGLLTLVLTQWDKMPWNVGGNARSTLESSPQSTLSGRQSAAVPPSKGETGNSIGPVGAIREKWVELGGATGLLGPVLSGEADAERGGRFNAFRSGFIYWHPNFGAHAVYGLIGEKWSALGRERNFGYPLTDELPGDNGGRYNDFENNATITWHPQAGIHSVYGFIRTMWIESGREKANGRCGYPTSDEYDYQNGRRTDFQRGYITWRRGARAAVAHCSDDEGNPAAD